MLEYPISCRYSKIDVGIFKTVCQDFDFWKKRGNPVIIESDLHAHFTCLIIFKWLNFKWLKCYMEYAKWCIKYFCNLSLLSRTLFGLWWKLSSPAQLFMSIDVDIFWIFFSGSIYLCDCDFHLWCFLFYESNS